MAHIYYRAERNSKYPWRVQFVKTIKGVRETFTGSFETEEMAKNFAREWEKVFYDKGKKALPYKQKRGGNPRKWVT
jgi:hypothetical protein